MAWRESENPKTREKWRLRVKQWRSSGLNQAAYARQQGFSPTSLRGWRRWFEREERELPALIELKLSEPAGSPVPDDTMIVELRDQRFVHLVPGFDPASVVKLVQLLERL
jgi:transposase-like protein